MASRMLSHSPLCQTAHFMPCPQCLMYIQYSTICVAVDVDECQFSDECVTLHGNLCLNTVGSYTCDCIANGFQLGVSGHSCEGARSNDMLNNGARNFYAASNYFILFGKKGVFD